MTNYQTALEHIKFRLPPSFTLSSAYIDFEEAIHEAVLKVWPTVTIRGCRFHLGQSCFKRIQWLGLATVYSAKDQFGSSLRTFFGFPFLRPDQVEDCFNELMANVPDHDAIKKFADYFHKNFIPATSRFPPALWAAYSFSVARTTNARESLHSKLTNMVYHSHPNIYIPMEVLMEIQDLTPMKINSVNDKMMRKPSRERKKFIQNLMVQRESDSITRLKFVKDVSRKFLPHDFKKPKTNKKNEK